MMEYHIMHTFISTQLLLAISYKHVNLQWRQHRIMCRQGQRKEKP